MILQKPLPYSASYSLINQNVWRHKHFKIKYFFLIIITRVYLISCIMWKISKNTPSILKYVWLFFIIIHKRVNLHNPHHIRLNVCFLRMHGLGLFDLHQQWTFLFIYFTLEHTTRSLLVFYQNTLFWSMWLVANKQEPNQREKDKTFCRRDYLKNHKYNFPPVERMQGCSHTLYINC